MMRTQITVSTHTFNYDHVFGGGNGLPPTALYNTCVRPLVDGLFKGYNATVLAYGSRRRDHMHIFGASICGSRLRSFLLSQGKI